MGLDARKYDQYRLAITHWGADGPACLAFTTGFFTPASFSISPTVNCAGRWRAEKLSQHQCGLHGTQEAQYLATHCDTKYGG
eukprot:1157773-Pelagomonas_calceolata.AAC.2